MVGSNFTEVDLPIDSDGSHVGHLEQGERIPSRFTSRISGSMYPLPVCVLLDSSVNTTP